MSASHSPRVTGPAFVFAGDQRVARPISVAVRSLVNVESDARIIVLADDWTPKDEECLDAAVPSDQVRIVQVSASGLPPGVGHISAAMYLRLLIPDVLKSERQAIYLDSDTLVRYPISQLIRDSGFEQSGLSTAGVQDSEVPFIGCAPGLAALRREGVDGRLPYINTGVLLMNLDLWRRDRIGPRIIEWKLEHPEAWTDNDALHGVLAGRLHLLPRHWNATVHMMRPSSAVYGFFEAEEIDRARKDPSIVHFTGAVKPWHSNASMPFLDEWRAVAAEVGWVKFPHSFTVRRRLERWLIQRVDSQA
jgi:lipopolysaccharide biosynthesis glycosyltransferase